MQAICTSLVGSVNFYHLTFTIMAIIKHVNKVLVNMTYRLGNNIDVTF